MLEELDRTQDLMFQHQLSLVPSHWSSEVLMILSHKLTKGPFTCGVSMRVVQQTLRVGYIFDHCKESFSPSAGSGSLDIF